MLSLEWRTHHNLILLHGSDPINIGVGALEGVDFPTYREMMLSMQRFYRGNGNDLS